MTVWFDLDGTIADFYGVDGWLDYLKKEDTTPYKMAKPLINFSILARYIHKMQNSNIKVGIISWGSKNGSADFLDKIKIAKLEWLAMHLPSVKFDTINIVAYGTPKSNFKTTVNDILFDDEEQNRIDFGNAYDVKNIFQDLKKILDK